MIISETAKFCTMKVYEMLKLECETLKTMSQNGIYINDYTYVEVYEQFRRMRSMGVKYEHALIQLSMERNIAKRTLQRAFKRLSKDC